jgi:hypothetical protein
MVTLGCGEHGERSLLITEKTALYSRRKGEVLRNDVLIAENMVKA